MHLLAIELKLERYSLGLTVANAVAKRRIRAAMQSEVQTKELRKIRNLPLLPQAQGEKPKENKDRLMIEDGMPKGTIGEQLQEMQDKADVISELQRELQKVIQTFKLSCLQNSSTNSNRVNNWTGNGVFKIQR